MDFMGAVEMRWMAMASHAFKRHYPKCAAYADGRIRRVSVGILLRT